MSEYTGKVIEAQADWLTVSAHGEKSAKALLDLGVGLLTDEEAHGARRRKWRMMGYEGLQAGRVRYGQRDTAATELALSGDLAATALDAAWALSDRVTRLDLAVTWQGDVYYPDLGYKTYQRAIEHYNGKPKSALPWSVNDAAGGYTCYLGDRHSEYHFRLYNKERQERKQPGKQYDGRYDRCWRYELELKASVPQLVLKKLTAAADRPEWVQGFLHTYADAHGLLPPFDPAGGQELIPGFRRASDEQSRLNHLSKNVRPTVEWLLERGRREDVLKGLGLS